MPSSTMKQVEMECDIPLWIPQDLLRSIFKRLPVRTLLNWRCACKDWKNHLDDPSFIQEHLEYSAHENPYLLYGWLSVQNTSEFCTVDSEMHVLPVETQPVIEFLRGVTVIGSINGLVCVKCNYTFKSNGKLINILVWNPAIRKFRLLTKEAGICVTMGFGFCSIVKDYKVVIISYDGNSFTGGIHQVEVYSLSTYSWKKVEFGRLLDGLEIRCDGFGTNGAIFWSGIKKGNGHLLVSYCIATEEFALIPSPISAAEFIHPPHCCRLSGYENKLALLSHTFSGNYEYTLIDLWVMEEGKDNKTDERWSWSKKYSVKHPYCLLPSPVWRNMIVCKYVEILRERNVSKWIVDGIVLVNLTTNELKRFAFRRNGVDFGILNYVESLVPVDKIHIEEL
ncbi:hypothetical protein K1719_016595 [Acacia pycnantha]|nr:hypothetical protein K1719_016595 [Acacia pycnantha]